MQQGLHLPDVWGEGQLLAFSALDGHADDNRGLVATTTAHAGLNIRLPFAAQLTFHNAAPTSTLLTGDVLDVQTPAGRTRGVLLDAYHLLIEGPCRITGQDAEMEAVQRGGRTLLAPRGLLDADLIDADVEKAIADRLTWLTSQALPEDLPELMRKLAVKCLSVMKTQVYSPSGPIRCRWTTPDRWPHRRMWLWDSAFHAIGWRRIDPSVARDAISAVMLRQRSDGQIGHMMDPDRATGITQPPVLTLAAALVGQVDERPDWLTGLYDGLSRYVLWDLANRDIDGGGLLEWNIEGNPECRSGESGMDNSPRFDAATQLDAPDFNAFVAHECELLAQLAEQLARPEDAQRWRTTHSRLCDLINERLWDESRGIYVDCDAATGKKSDVISSAGFLPLLCGAPTKEQAKQLAEHLTDPRTFGTALPVPSIPPTDETHYSTDMWRGPTWINVNWLIARGLRRYGMDPLAQNIRARTLEEVARWYASEGTVFEYYDAQGKVSPRELLRKRQCTANHPHMCLRDYGWTATLCVDWLWGGSRAASPGAV